MHSSTRYERPPAGTARSGFLRWPPGSVATRHAADHRLFIKSPQRFRVVPGGAEWVRRAVPPERDTCIRLFRRSPRAVYGPNFSGWRTSIARGSHSRRAAERCRRDARQRSTTGSQKHCVSGLPPSGRSTRRRSGKDTPMLGVRPTTVTACAECRGQSPSRLTNVFTISLLPHALASPTPRPVQTQASCEARQIPVPPTGQYSKKCPQVEGHVVRLSGRHAKLRREGYRMRKHR
jgi:hypothetical protein